MSWQGTEEFVAVVEHGSFTQAARKLQISTAQVSRQVSYLENRLNVALLYRTTRKVTLTQPGQVYYHHVKNLLNGLEQAEQAVQDMGQTPQGLIRITAPGYYGEQRLAPLVNDFLLRYRQVTVEYLFTNQQLDLFDQGIDLAIRLGPHPEQQGVFSRQLTTRQLKVCASPSYIATYGQPKRLEDLKAHNCLLGTLGFWRFRRARRAITQKVKGSMRCSSGVALLDAAQKGLGIVQLPDYYVDTALHDGSLVELLLDYQSEEEGVWAIYPHQHQISVNVRALLRFLTERFEQNKSMLMT